MDFDSIPDEGPESVKAPPIAQNAAPKQVIDFDALPDDSEKYQSGSQTLLAGLEGVGRVFAGPLATGAEQFLSSRLNVPGLTPEARAAREARSIGEV